MPLVTPGTEVPKPAAAPVANDADKLARKKATDKAWAEKKKQQKADLIDYLSKQQNLPANIAAILDEYKNGAKRSGGGGGFGPSKFNVIFGDNPTVGQKITLNDVLKKHFIGVKEMGSYLKKWASKGKVVKFVENSADYGSSEYVIQALG